VTRPGPLITLACVGAAIGTAAALVVTAPDPTLPKIPGAVNPEVTQTNIHQTICVRGWTATVRPSRSWSSRFKHKLALKQHVSAGDFELDHEVSLEVGGSPKSPQNLWLQPWSEARRDDNGIEARLHRAICSGELTLAEGRQQEIDWKEKHG
jgi:hypothetical protein